MTSPVESANAPHGMSAPGAGGRPPSFDVSVVIPTFNRHEQLQQTLASMASQVTSTPDGQTFTFEVVVVSDGSEDGTVDALHAIRTPFPLTIIDQGNAGPAAARNAGIEASSGDLIVFIDDDVIAEPGCVAAHVDRHSGTPGLVVIGPMLTPDEALEPWVAWEQRQLEKQYEAFPPDGAAHYRQFYTGNASVGRQALLDVGGFDVSYRRAEDVELAHRLSLAGHTFSFERRARAYHHARRSFPAWRRVASAYGANDVSFGRNGQPEILQLIGMFFGERHWSQRWFVRGVVPYRRLAHRAESVLNRGVRLSHSLGLDRPTQQLLSAVYSLRYYGAVRDSVGSRREFVNLLRARNVGDGGAGRTGLTAWFLLEQTLGHVTHGKNLQHLVPQLTAIVPTFMPVDAAVGDRAQRLPGWSNWTVRAGVRARTRLRKRHRAVGLLPDALFVHSQVPAVLLGRWMRRIPTVVSLDATPLQYDELGEFYAHDTGGRLAERAKFRANVRCFERARHLVAWSAWAKHGLTDAYGVPDEKVTVIAPGVDVTRWRRPSDRASRSDQSSGIDAPPLRILFVGGDLDRKGGALLLRASTLLRERPDVAHFEVHLVTTADIDPPDGVVVHRGLTANSPELIEQYHQADVFCLPTLGDCLPMVLAEAAAAGLPLISTNVGAIAEIVRDGETGTLIEPDDLGQLESALHRMLTDSEFRHRCGDNASNLAEDAHDARANARRIIEVLRTVADPAQQD